MDIPPTPVHTTTRRGGSDSIATDLHGVGARVTAENFRKSLAVLTATGADLDGIGDWADAATDADRVELGRYLATALGLLP